MNRKKQMYDYIDSISHSLNDISDKIFDNPELGFEEYFARGILSEAFEAEGFQVQLGIGGIDTAFRAVYERGEGGKAIGLLCEYDALENLGHGCGHHMQGPSILGCALAVKKCVTDKAFKLVIYGTPAEEGGGGKIVMLKNGCFKDIDLALMMHGGPATTTDIKSLATASFSVTYHGKSAHAAVKPEAGRSAFDAMLLAFHGIELLREHVREDTRMHYTVLDAGGPENIVPAKAVGRFQLRSYSTAYLSQLIERFEDIICGSARMAGVTCHIEELNRCKAKIPVPGLNQLLMDNAKAINAPNMGAPREKTGSTDFADVMNEVPGSCIRVAFVPSGTSPHSQEYVDAGKSREAYSAIGTGAKILAGAIFDMLENPELIEEYQRELKEAKEAEFTAASGLSASKSAHM